ncbi:MAG: cupin domain-containing protein [Acidobacteria bacterium]|nr:cupin domain-containing protein [Acidobacteriota bacterium]
MVKRGFLCSLVAGLLFCAPVLQGQNRPGTISGLVRDESGSPRQGVTLTITHKDTGTKGAAVTDNQGRYQIPNLALGDYEIETALSGFRVARREQSLRVGKEKAEVDLTLEAGEGNRSGRIMPEAPNDKTPYDEWLEKLEIPVSQGLAVEDTRKIEVKPWKETGGLGAYFRLSGTQFLDARVEELPPGASLKGHRHLHEENIYILEGKGYTMLQQESRRPQKIEWQRDTAFSIPLNVFHQHVNTDAKNPARFLALTNFPFTLNTFGNPQFVGGVEYAFRDRYDAEENFTKLSTNQGGREQIMNVIPNVKQSVLYQYESRGVGATAMNVRLGGNQVLGGAGISEIPAGRYHRAHAHLNEAFIYITEGEGYSLIWEDDFKKRTKVDWKEGSLVGVPKYWYHQHFNIGEKPARFVRYTTSGYLSRLGTNFQTGDVPYEEENPEVEKLFRASSRVIDPVMEEIWKKKKTGSN